MKTNIIRLSVLTLALSGFAAASVSAHARTMNKASVAPMPMVGSTPLCAPSDPSKCGMD